MHSYLNRFWNFSTLTISALMLLLTLLATWQLQTLSRDWSLQTLHRQGEERLLAYISTIRRDLNRFKPMPFVLSQSQDVRRLLSGGATDLTADVNLFLEQANQVSGTRSWEVLDPEGKRIASSDWRQHPEQLQPSYVDKAVFSDAIDGEYGGFFNLASSRVPLYYLSAPIYAENQLIGIALISIDLNRLQESWTTSRDLLAISDTSGLIFLSSFEPWRYRHLPLAIDSLESSRPSSLSDRLPYRWSSEQLSDATRIVQMKAPQGEGFLVQSVLLDDQQWNIHYLSDLAPIVARQRSVILFSLGAGLAATLVVLLLRERWLRSLSIQETAALRLNNEAQQRAIINNTQVGLITLDAQGLVRFINSRALMQFATSSEQTLGRPIDQLIAPEQGLIEVQQLSDKLAQRRSIQPLNLLECLGRRADGSHFPIMMSINPIEWDDGDGYLVTLVDITKRKRAEQALQQANDELELRVQQRSDALRQVQAELIQQSKLAALGTMSAAIAHELNQPLTVIRNASSSARLLLQRQQPEQAQTHLNQVVQMTSRMALITDQLKTFAHKRPQQLQAVNIAEVLNTVLEMFSTQIQQLQVQLQRDHSGEAAQALWVWADQPRVEQVLINLIRNALDALQDLPVRELIISTRRQQAHIEIDVADSGPGLTQPVLDHLFDPFFTTKDIGQGLGLGLSISYGIVRDLEGSIRASNRPEGGALFRLQLPVATTESFDS